MPSLIKKISGRLPSLPRIPEPSDSSEEDLPPPIRPVAWSPSGATQQNSNQSQEKSREPDHAISDPGGTRNASNISRQTVGPETRTIGESRTTSHTNKSPSRSRYIRTPVRLTVAGEWAIKETETLTTWVNSILRTTSFQPIVDLRKCVGDGLTLVKLTEKTCGELSDVNTEINSRKDRIKNVQLCLDHLKTSGVDLTAIDAEGTRDAVCSGERCGPWASCYKSRVDFRAIVTEDIADGNLKSTLLLVGNIKRKVDSDVSTQLKTTEEKHVAKNAMPGAITLPGGIREPPLGVSDYPSSHQRRANNVSSEDMLPGLMKREEMVTRPQSVPPAPIISMTELSPSGVLQRGVEERRQQLYVHGNAQRGGQRQSAAKPNIPNNKPTLSNAWSIETQKPQSGGASSVEERLKSLITSPASETSRFGTLTPVDVTSKSFDDGELLVPFPPQPRAVEGAQHQRYPSVPVQPQSLSYVPSKPNDRYHGSRAEAILQKTSSGYTDPSKRDNKPLKPSYNQPSRVHNKLNSATNHPNKYTYDDKPHSYNDPSRILSQEDLDNHGNDQVKWTYHGGHDNLAFHREGSPIRSKREITRERTPGSESSTADVADGMRDAWNKLYGGRPQVEPVLHPQSLHQQGAGENYVDMSVKETGHVIPSSALRTSPMGQSVQGQGLGSSSSPRSSSQASPSSISFSGFVKPSSNQDHGSSTQQTLGPSSKYPEFNSQRNTGSASENAYADALKVPFAHSKGIQGESKRMFSRNNSDSTFQDPEVSIFDYHHSPSEASSRSVTPPLPPLSNSDSESSVGGPNLPRSSSTGFLSSQKTPDLVTSTTRGSDKKSRRASSSLYTSRNDKKYSNKVSANLKFPKSQLSERGQDSGVLSDVREHGTDSDLPFDIEDTILTVDSIDTEMQSMQDGIQKMYDHSVDENLGGMKERLNNLEGLYSEVVRVLGSGAPARRRWSLASSDTSSLRRPVRKIKAATGNSHTKSHHHNHKDVKAINRRFQRLESHVVTLARSVAHLSSELRSHNSMVNELEAVRKEVREMKEQQFIMSHQSGMNSKPTLEHYTGWAPSLTNPKRINKLTQFFGEEPPLMNLFLKNLGYEKFLPNFDAEHIGMLELPYMNEERLEKIGIPMGPRLRILQEAQHCFQQENLNIYIV